MLYGRDKEKDNSSVRRAVLMAAAQPLAQAQEDVGSEPGLLGADRARTAEVMEQIGQYAPTVGTVAGGTLGGVTGGALGALGGAAAGFSGGPVGMLGGAVSGGLTGAATGAGLGSGAGGAVGGLAGQAAQGYADDYNQDVQQQAMAEENRRRQMLSLLAAM